MYGTVSPRQGWPLFRYRVLNILHQISVKRLLFALSLLSDNWQMLVITVKHPINHLKSSPKHLSSRPKHLLSIYKASDRLVQSIWQMSVRCFVLVWQMLCICLTDALALKKAKRLTDVCQMLWTCLPDALYMLDRCTGLLDRCFQLLVRCLAGCFTSSCQLSDKEHKQIASAWRKRWCRRT